MDFTRTRYPRFGRLHDFYASPPPFYYRVRENDSIVRHGNERRSESIEAPGGRYLGNSMIDLIYVAVIIVFFGLCVLYTQFCEKL